jgi:hypothetical protein
MDKQKFLTISETSLATGYSVEHLRELCKKGVVRPERIALGRLFSQADVRTLRARRARTVTTKQGES